MRLSQEPSDEDELAEPGVCVDGHRAAVQREAAAHEAACETLSTWSKERHGAEEPHSGAGGLTANYDHTVTEDHTVVLNSSADHAVAKSPKTRRRMPFSQ